MTPAQFVDSDSNYDEWNEIQTSISGLDVGNYQLWGQAVDNSGEASDWYRRSFSVYYTDDISIDLSGAKFDVVQESINRNNSGFIAIDFEVENTGSDYAEDIYVDFYLSNDQNISKSDKFLGSYTPLEIDGNDKTQSLSRYLTLPSIDDSIWNSSGTYYLGMIIDYPNLIPETNELNNSNIGLGYDYDQVYVSI